MIIVVVIIVLICPRFNPYSAGIDFRRQIVTSKVDPRTVRIKIFLIAVDP